MSVILALVLITAHGQHKLTHGNICAHRPHTQAVCSRWLA